MSDGAVIEVAPGIHRISWTLGVRRIAQWAVVGDDGVLVIDTGVSGAVADHIAPALERIGLAPSRISHVAVSHADVDHYGGNAEMRRWAPGARLLGSAEDRPLIESWSAIWGARYGWYEGEGLGYDPETREWLRSAAGPDTPLDGVLADGDVIDLGGVSIEILALPGHSAGHLGFLDRRSGCAIVVDAVLERGLYDVSDNRISPPPYVTADGYRRSLARLVRLDPDRMETAHYRDIAGGEVARFLNASAAFVDDLDDVILEAVRERPRTVAELTAIGDRRLGPFSSMALELARSVRANLDDLEREGAVLRAAATPARWAAA